MEGAAGETEGGFGKLGAAGAVAAAAVVALGVKSILAFEDLGLTVGKFSSATGISAESSSRLIEVAGDLGIGTSTLQSSIGKMEQTLGKNSTAFDKYGVTVVKAKDGSIDANATFLNSVDALNKIEDPTKRAAAGAAIFGKGWQGMAQLIGQDSDKLRSDLAAVDDAKIFDEEKVHKAEALRDGFDKIKDAGENLFLTIGTALAPVVATLAETLAKVIEKVSPLAEAIGGLLATALEAIGPIIEGVLAILGPLVEGLGKVLGVVEDIVSGIGDAFKDNVDAALDSGLAEYIAKVKGETVTAASAAAELKQKEEDAAAAAEEEARAEKELTDKLKATVKSLNEQITALTEQKDAMRGSADAGYAAKDAADDFLTKTEELTISLASGTLTQRESDKAIRDATSSAATLADAQVTLAMKTAESEGKTLTASKQLDVMNSSMLNSAATATGPLRQSIIDYIAETNKVPADKVTALKAAIEAGDLAKAQTILDDASKARDVTVRVDADAASLAATNRALDAIAKNRTVAYIPSSHTSVKAFAAGTENAPAGVHLVGEQGPELAFEPAGTVIKTARQTAALLGNSTTVYNDNRTTIVNVPPSVSVSNLLDAQRELTRRGLDL